MAAQSTVCGSIVSLASVHGNCCEEKEATRMTHTPTADQPAFATDEPQHCRGWYRLS